MIAGLSGQTLLGLCLLVPWVAGLALLPLDGRRRPVAWGGVAALLLTLVVQAGLAVAVWRDGPLTVVTGNWPLGVGVTLAPDALGLVFALLSTVVLTLALVAEALKGVEERAFPSMLAFLAMGLTGLFLTGDIFSFYVFFEVSMTASYVVATYRGGYHELRAAIVFGGVNLLGTFVFLIAVAGTYRVTGTLAMDQVAERFAMVEEEPQVLLAAAFFVAFALKLGLFPFSFWLPIVYVEARPAAAAVLAGAVANIGAYGVLRFGVDVLPTATERGAAVLVVLGCVSILYGGVLAVARKDLSETLAYSSIGQVGYVLVAVGVGGPVGLAAAVLYTIVNALNKTLLFLCVGQRGRLVASATVVGALSVAGIPPAVGYLSKFQVFRAGLLLDAPVAAQAAVMTILVVGGLLSLLYMTQWYIAGFWAGADPTIDPAAGGAPVGVRGSRILVAGVAAAIVAAGVWPQPLLVVADDAAITLLGSTP